MKARKAQVLVGAILLIAVLAILIPAMLMFVQHETRQSEKERQNNNAFQLAEGAVDRAYQKLVESTTTWNNLIKGQIPAGYDFNTSFTDLSGGTYTISVTSGPGNQQATVIGIGRDKLKKEARALKVVYSNAALSATAMQARGTISLDGSNEQVEWGAVMSPKAIATNDRDHPQFYSAANISPQDPTGNNVAPNSDGVQWWSWYSGIPPASRIDLEFYRSSAVATGTYYTAATVANFKALCDDGTTCNTGKTYYILGDLNVAAPGIYVGGNLIVTGNMTLPSGLSGQGSPTVLIPQTAWKQYGNDWAFYKASKVTTCSEDWSDPTAPAAFPGLNSSYKSAAALSKTFDKGKVVTNGFLYVGGTLADGGGGGGACFVGSAYVVGTVTFTSNNNCFFYTDAGAARVVTTDVSLTRTSWADSIRIWPAALP